MFQMLWHVDNHFIDAAVFRLRLRNLRVEAMREQSGLQWDYLRWHVLAVH